SELCVSVPPDGQSPKDALADPPSRGSNPDAPPWPSQEPRLRISYRHRGPATAREELSRSPIGPPSRPRSRTVRPRARHTRYPAGTAAAAQLDREPHGLAAGNFGYAIAGSARSMA